MPLILEGIVTTTNVDGSTNVAPMGPIVDRGVTQLTLRPFQSSTTYQNLRRERCGVFHIIDDVELLVRAAVNRFEVPPPTVPCQAVPGRILVEACDWLAFRVRELDDREPRTRIECEVVQRGKLRDGFGFNRAKHAVLEAAILATRVGIVPQPTILADLERLAVIVEKTAGDQEQRAWQLIVDSIHERLRQAESTE